MKTPSFQFSNSMAWCHHWHLSHIQSTFKKLSRIWPSPPLPTVSFHHHHLCPGLWHRGLPASALGLLLIGQVPFNTSHIRWLLGLKFSNGFPLPSEWKQSPCNDLSPPIAILLSPTIFLSPTLPPLQPHWSADTQAHSCLSHPHGSLLHSFPGLVQMCPPQWGSPWLPCLKTATLSLITPNTSSLIYVSPQHLSPCNVHGALLVCLLTVSPVSRTVSGTQLEHWMNKCIHTWMNEWMNGFFTACQFPHFAYGNQNWILSPTIKSVLTHMEMTGKSGVNDIYAGAEHRGDQMRSSEGSSQSFML